MKKFAVIGLGLIGGSIYKRLKTIGADVIGISNSQCGSEPDIFNDINLVSKANVIFVCTPMHKTFEILDKLELIVSETTIVTDVCSIKEFVCKKERPYRFIPSHPMAGTEFQGFENSFDTLFEGAKWIFTPFQNNTTEQDIKTLSESVKDFGAKPIVTSPQQHDEAVALISHMPMLFSQALVKAVEGNELAQQLAASGFRDTTRLALTNVDMALDMVNLNHENIQKSVLKLYSALGEILKNDYAKNAASCKNLRESMYKDGKNIL